jgi:hypothetical protein
MPHRAMTIAVRFGSICAAGARRYASANSGSASA